MFIYSFLPSNVGTATTPAPTAFPNRLQPRACSYSRPCRNSRGLNFQLRACSYPRSCSSDQELQLRAYTDSRYCHRDSSPERIQLRTCSDSRGHSLG